MLDTSSPVPLDFLGNRDRILESIKLAKSSSATLRTGPELEIPGYGSDDSDSDSYTEEPIDEQEIYGAYHSHVTHPAVTSGGVPPTPSRTNKYVNPPPDQTSYP